MHIDIGDQVTIVHKDFVAICKVMVVRAPTTAIDHTDCEDASAEAAPSDGPACSEEFCRTGLRPTVIQVVRATPRGD